MQRRNRIILIIVGLVVIVVVLFLAVWTRPEEEKIGKEKPPAAVEVGAEPTPEAKIETRQATAEEIARAETQTLSANFAERFGSYSNDGNFENVIDLYPFMTSLMKNWAENYVEKLRAEIQKETYEGITTRAVSVQFTSLKLDEGKAETVVKTQRTEVKSGQPEPKVYYQDLRLELLKIGGEWKVDGAYWVK